MSEDTREGLQMSTFHLVRCRLCCGKNGKRERFNDKADAWAWWREHKTTPLHVRNVADRARTSELVDRVLLSLGEES